MKIFIIEDDANKCKDIIRCLQERLSQVKIDCASSYAKGIKKGCSGNYNIIIVDNCLPFYDDNPIDLHPDMAELIIEELVEFTGDSVGKFIICSQYEKEEEGEKLRKVQKRNKEVCLGVVKYENNSDKWKDNLIRFITTTI